MVRHLVMRLPVLQTLIVVGVWAVGIALGSIAALRVDGRLASVVLTSTLLTGFVVAVLTYLQAERLVRPIAASALARRFEDSTLQPPITSLLYLTWFTTSAVPMVGVLLLTLAQREGYFTGTAGELTPAIVAIISAGLLTGFVGTAFAVMSVVDPIKELQGAIHRVRHGEADTQVDIYDGSEIGVLQAGFNEMMRGLRDRQRVRDIFSQYVGAEVAQKALEERPELGGEDRKVAVLFIDVVGSTTFAVDHTPEEVVEALNEFFEIVVQVVHRNKGVINKFQGDAALAVFGAPVSLHDAASHALQAARELQRELAGLELKAGIGVASGHVVAGHIGGADRFEYTVIGDAVNGAARLTDLAKDTPGKVLTNAATLRAANEVEQQRWTLMKSVELRGRGKMTQLARPVSLHDGGPGLRHAELSVEQQLHGAGCCGGHGVAARGDPHGGAGPDLDVAAPVGAACVVIIVDAVYGTDTAARGYPCSFPHRASRAGRGGSGTHRRCGDTPEPGIPA